MLLTNLIIQLGKRGGQWFHGRSYITRCTGEHTLLDCRPANAEVKRANLIKGHRKGDTARARTVRTLFKSVYEQ